MLARREPGNQRSTDNMMMMEAKEVVPPRQIAKHTTNVDEVKGMLNRLAGIPNLGFDPQSTSGFKARASFRDLMAFLFQPQNVVANPDVFFFKADTDEHREKLKTIFPYVLGAVTPRDSRSPVGDRHTQQNAAPQGARTSGRPAGFPAVADGSSKLA